MSITQLSDAPDKVSISDASEAGQKLFSSLGELLAHYGRATPEQTAILAPGRTSLSYGALWDRTQEIVGQMRGFGIGVGDRVAVVLPSGADAAVATVGVAAGAVCVPLHPGFSSEEVQRYLRDLQVSALLTQPDMESASRSAAYSLGIPVIDLSLRPGDPIGSFSLVCSGARQAVTGEMASASDDAFVLLTSGSSAQPKLVPLTQAGVGHSAYQAGAALALRPRDRLINVQPLAHAHGLISGLLTALAAGSSVVCPEAFDATAFLGWLTSFRATWYTAVPPIHRALISAARRRNRRLPSSLRLIRSASSSLPVDVLYELEGLFGVPVIETYGMTEAASQIAANPLERRKPGSVGKSAGAEIAIMDGEGRKLPPGERGEVVLRGPAITRGYHNNEIATRTAFRDGWFRTGDLGYLDTDGYLFVLGRIKKADIINRGGQKVSPMDVERALLGHPDVAEAVAFPIPHTRLGEDVAAAVVPRAGSKIDTRKLRRFVSERVARFKVPGLIRIVPAIPVGPDGKVVRGEIHLLLSIAAPRSHLRRSDHLTPPRSQTEWQLARIWADLLGLNQVGVDEDVFALGADSLTIGSLLARLRSRFGADLSFRDIFDAPTVAALATLLESSKNEPAAQGIELKAARETDAPLSLQQQRIHVLSKIDPIPYKHHVISGTALSGPLETSALETSIATICERHETLRSIFSERSGEPAQTATAARTSVEHLDFRHLPESGRAAAIQAQTLDLLRQPFDPETAPPIRIQLLRFGERDHFLLTKLHHLITDGWSQRLFFAELEQLYNARARGLAPELAEMPFQYRHFVEWQRAWLKTPAAEAQLSYWRERLEGLTELPLRTDRPRPERWIGSGARVPLILSRTLSRKLRSLSRANDVTLFMTLLAAFQCLLCRYTHHYDIAVGSLIANRNQVELERLIGMFANMVVLRADLSGDPTFREVLRRARDVTLDAYRNQELPIEEILRVLRLPRNLDRNPLFRAIFVLQKAPKPLALHELSVRATEQDPGTSRTDLMLELTDDATQLNGWIEYSDELFEPGAIKRMAAHFRTLLESIVANPDQPISRLKLLPAAERQQVLAGWNQARARLRAFRSFSDCFARQVGRTPAAPAVSFGRLRLSYGELAGRAAAIASRLRRERVGPDDLVVLFAERGIDLLAAMIAVLEAGGAFLPLDPTMPPARLAGIIQHSDARLVLATRRSAVTMETTLSGLPRKRRPRVLILETLAAARSAAAKPPARRSPSSLACVIYTSGSTGSPKGAMIEQRGMLNHLLSKISDLELSASDVVAQTSPQSFVIALWQFLAPLMVGARVHILDDEQARDPVLLAQEAGREGVTVLETVPSLLRAILQPSPSEAAAFALSRLRSLVSTGESLAPDLCRDWFRHFPHVALINAYGATECSDDVATHRLAAPPPASATTPIGRPIANIQLYVLDQYLEPVPIGVVGELYAGGVGIGRGYLNDPEQTRRRFLRDPFSKNRAARLYRTGDLARWRSDGTLECFGRIDHQVKIRGCRVEVEEIEHALAQHSSIRSAAVMAQENGRGETQLTAYLVPTGKNPDLDELGDFARTRLPAHMIPAGYVFLPRLPLTAHGKLDRRALAGLGARPEATRRDVVAPRSATEQQLASIWADQLELDEVGVRSNFFDLGGHSLLAGRVLARVASVFGVSLPIRALFEASTIEALARRIEAARAMQTAETQPESANEGGDSAPVVSILQDHVLRIERELPGLPQFNLPYAFRLRGPLNVGALERSLAEVVRRHDSLRTCFRWADGRPVPSVSAASPAASPLGIEDLSSAAPAGGRRAEALQLKKAELRVAQASWTPFDPARGPLFRAHLLRLAPDDHVFFLIMHHVIVDGWSMGLLFEEMAELYAGFAAGRPVSLPAPASAFSDFAAWQRRWSGTEAATGQLAFWKDRLRGASPLFPTDARGAGELLSSDIAHEPFHLPKDLIARLTALSGSEGGTAFMALLAGFKAVLLARTGRGDICVGTTMANRARQWTERIVGPVENTTIVRTPIDRELSFREILRRVRHSVLEAHARQDLPFELLVERLAEDDHLDLTSLAQVFFIFQNAFRKPLELSEIAVQSFGSAYNQGLPVLPIDGACLTVTLEEETPTGIGGACSYKTDLLSAKAAKSWIADYKTILAQAIADPDRPLGLLTSAPRKERRLIASQQA